MTNILTVRLTDEEMAECDYRVRELNVTRSDYVRSRLFTDSPATNQKRRFLSNDLIGSFAIGRGSDNASVRSAMRKKR